MKLKLRSMIAGPLRVASALVLVTVSCAIAPSASAAGKLNIYNWGDYINPDVLTRFTKDTGIEVTLDSSISNIQQVSRTRTVDAA